MGDDMGPGSVCFDFCYSEAQYSCLWSPNDHRRQPVIEPKPMSSPNN